MSAKQLGKRLSVTPQSVLAMEARERDGTITLSTLKEAANALDMQLVYGFVPKNASLEALVEQKAKKLATEIVMRTSVTMRLEDQENPKERIQKSIEEMTYELKREMPKMLGDL